MLNGFNYKLYFHHQVKHWIAESLNEGGTLDLIWRSFTRLQALAELLEFLICYIDHHLVVNQRGDASIILIPATAFLNED